MKHMKTIIIGVICAALVFGYYFYLSTRDRSESPGDEPTEVEQVLDLDLKDKYPTTPREVVKVYNQILCCYYNEEYSEKEFQKLIEQQRSLFDEELLGNNPEPQFGNSMRNDINDYKENKRTIEGTTLCSTDEVVYKTVDDRECAYVTCSYFIKNGNEGFDRSYQRYVLRKDDDGNWKILVYYLIEGEDSGE